MGDGGLVWRKSTHCETVTCVEVGFQGRSFYIRDSKNPGQILDISLQVARSFIESCSGLLVARTDTDPSRSAT